MRVSVVIPTHDYGHFVAEAIESVRKQTFADWECIVVDDGSTDDTAETVKAIADRRVRLVRQEQAGPSAARNRGLAESTGELVQFLDADDLLGPSKLEAHVRILGERPDVDLVYCGARFFADSVESNEGPAQTRALVDRPVLHAASGSGPEMLPALVDDNIMVIEGPLIRRSLLDRVGGFDPTLRRMEDWEYWLRCALAGARFLYDPSEDPERLCQVRIHGTSSSGHRFEMQKSDLRVREGLDDRLPTRELRRLNRRRFNEQSADLGIREGLDCAPASGIRRLLRAGIEERHPRWLVWAVLLPVLRTRLGTRFVSSWRTPRPSQPH